MTEIGQPDLSRLLTAKRNEFNSIVTSRKRKLRELFAVATHTDALPHDSFENTETPTSTQAEWQFLQANDVLKGRKFDDTTVPQRSLLSLDALKKALYPFVFPARDSTPQQTPLVRSEPNANDASTSKADSNTTVDGTSVHPVLTQPISSSPSSTTTKPGPQARNTTELKLSVQQGRAESSGKTDNNNQPRQAQVSFPPGLKGSPTADGGPGKDDDSRPDAISRTGKEAGGAQDEETRPRASENAPLKLSTEPSRITDAASSPGSTAPSATTPAIHDDSTDTSPDHEGPQYEEEQDTKTKDIEGSEKKEEDGSTADVSASLANKQDDALAAQNTAESQLLQESMRSSEGILGQSKDTRAEGTSPKQQEQLEKPAASPHPKPSHFVTDKHVVQPSAEIPDSEDDRMDLDAPSFVEQEHPVQDKVSPRGSIALSENVPSASTKPAKLETPPVPERAVTRVSSGAMRLKSVSEIVGDSSRFGSASERKNSENQLTPLTSTPISPPHRSKYSHGRDRPKNPKSTVLFGRQSKRSDTKSLMPVPKETTLPTDDYFTPLFLQGFAQSSNWMQPIEKILYHANKTIATPDISVAIQDSQACKILRRVYALQQQDKWSLRQLKRSPEPPRTTSHWDMVLKEAKWMRTDFREERKWKMALAKNLAYACSEWHEASAEQRKAMQVPTYIPQRASARDDATPREDASDSHSTPDLIPSADADSMLNYDELLEDFGETVSPSAIFTLQEDDVIFGLRRTAAADQLLEELPLYGAPLELPINSLALSEYDPDAHWKRPALPLSKYVEGHMDLDLHGPPRKRSRYAYSADDSEDENDFGFVSGQSTRNVILPPDSDEVAMFHPEQRHTRDRLHAGHQFRPPSEHPMPSQDFFESRQGSQWTVAEDDELRGLVREYAYNWTLISSLLSTRSIFKSSAERRTPWECFERWVSLEGLPNDLQRTQYFKTYNSRIEAGQRLVNSQNQAAAQAAQANGLAPLRRRQSVPIRVDRRKAQKHLTIIDAMRKLAKKRETTLQKQQHNASQNAQNKKINEAITRGPTKTPRDYSILRWERDQALADKVAQFAQRQEATRRAQQMSRAQNQNQAQAANQQGQASGVVNGLQPGASNNASNKTARPNIPPQMAGAVATVAQQALPRAQVQASANGLGQNGIPQVNGNLTAPGQMTAQQQLQALQGQQHRMHQVPGQQPDPQMIMQARRMQEQHRMAQLHQVQQQQGANGAAVLQGQQQTSPPLRGSNMNQQNFMNNQQAMKPKFTVNGNPHSGQQANGLHMPNGPGGSPGPRPGPQFPPNIALQVAQIEANLRAKNPSLNADQVRQLATDHLARAVLTQRQNAMNAAAGGTPQLGATTSPHQYAAMLRQQQAQQQAQQHVQQGQQGQQPQHQQQAQQGQQQQQQQAMAQQRTTPMSTSPVPIPSQPQVHQRQASGSVTPAAGK